MVEALTIVVGSIISIVAVYIVVLDDNGVFASHACGQIGEQIGGQFHLRNMHC